MEENENVIYNNNNKVNVSDNTNDIDDLITKHKGELTSLTKSSFEPTMNSIITDGVINKTLIYINNNINTKKSCEYIEFVYYVFAILTNGDYDNNTTFFNNMLLTNKCDDQFKEAITSSKDHLDTPETKTILNTIFKCIYLIIHELLKLDPSSQNKNINSRDYFMLFFINVNDINSDMVSVILHFIYEIVKDHSHKLSSLGLNNEESLSKVLNYLFTFINTVNKAVDVTLNKEIEFKALIIAQTIIQDNSIIKSAKRMILGDETIKTNETIETLFSSINAIISEEGLIIMGNILKTVFEVEQQSNLVEVVLKYEFLEKDYYDLAHFEKLKFIKHAHELSKNKKENEIVFYSKLFNVIYALFMQNAAVYLDKREINDKLRQNIKRLLRGKSNNMRNENDHVCELRKTNNVFQIARIATFTMNIIQSNLHLDTNDIYDLIWYLFITVCDVLLIKATDKDHTHIEQCQIKNTFQTLIQFIIENAYRNDNFIYKVFAGVSRGSLNFYKYFKPLMSAYNKCDNFVYNFLNEIDKDIIYKKENYAAKSEICKLIIMEDYEKLELRLSLSETEKFIEVNDQAINDMCNVFSDSNSNVNDKKKIDIEGIMMAIIALMRNDSILNKRKYEPLFKLMEYLCYESDDYLDKALKENETIFSLLWHINDVLSRRSSTSLHNAINNDDNNTLIDFIVFLLNEEQLTSQIFNLICAIMNTLLDGSSALHVDKVNQFITLNGIGMLVYHLNNNGSDDIHFAMLIRKFVEHIKPINSVNISDDKAVNDELSYCLNEMTICEMVNQITHIEDVVNNEHSNSNDYQQQVIRYNKTINANHYCALIELLNQLCLYMFNNKQLHRMGVSVVEQTNIITFIINELQASYSPEDSLLSHETCTFYVLLHILTLISNQPELIKYLCVKSLFSFIESVYTCSNSETLPLEKITLAFSTIMYNVLKDKDCGKWIYMKSKVKRCVHCIRKDVLKKESKLTENDVDDFIRLVNIVIDIEKTKWNVKERDKVITKAIEDKIKSKYGEDKFQSVVFPEEESGLFNDNEEEDNDNDNDNDNSGNIVHFDGDNSKELLRNSNVNNSSSVLLFNSSFSENPNTLINAVRKVNAFTNELVNSNNNTNVHKLNTNLSSIANTLINKKELPFDVPYQSFMNELVNALNMLITSSEHYNNVTVLAYVVMDILITSNACNELIENELIVIDNSNSNNTLIQCVIDKFTTFIEEDHAKIKNINDDDNKKIFKSLTSIIAFIIHSNTLYNKYKTNFTNTASTLFECVKKLDTALSDIIAQCVYVIVELLHKDKNATLDNFNSNNIKVDDIINTFIKLSIINNNNNTVTPVSDVIKSDVQFIEQYYRHPNRDEFLKVLIKRNLPSPDKVFSFLNSLLQCDQIYISHITTANKELQQLFTSCVNNNNITHIQQIISFYNAIDSDDHDELAYTKGIYDKVINYFTYQLPINKFSETDLKNTLALIIKVHRLAENKAVYNDNNKYNMLFTSVFSNEHADKACSYIVDLLSIAIQNDVYMVHSNNNTNLTNFITKTFTSLVNTHDLTEADKSTLEKLIDIITKIILSIQTNKTFLNDFLSVFRKCSTSYLFNLLCNRFMYIIANTNDNAVKVLCKQSITICVELTVQHKDIFINDDDAMTSMIDLIKSVDVVKYQTKEEFVNAYGCLLDMFAFINRERIKLKLNDVSNLLEYMCKIINNNDSQDKVNLIAIDKFKEWCAFVMGCIGNAEEDEIEGMKEEVEKCMEGALGEGNEGVEQWIEMCSVEMEKFVDEPKKLELVVGMVKNEFDHFKTYLNDVYSEAQRGEKRFVAVLKVIDAKYKDNEENSEIVLNIKNNVKAMIDSISSS